MNFCMGGINVGGIITLPPIFFSYFYITLKLKIMNIVILVSCTILQCVLVLLNNLFSYCKTLFNSKTMKSITNINVCLLLNQSISLL